MKSRPASAVSRASRAQAHLAHGPSRRRSTIPPGPCVVRARSSRWDDGDVHAPDLRRTGAGASDAAASDIHWRCAGSDPARSLQHRRLRTHRSPRQLGQRMHVEVGGDCRGGVRDRSKATVKPVPLGASAHSRGAHGTKVRFARQGAYTRGAGLLRPHLRSDAQVVETRGRPGQRGADHAGVPVRKGWRPRTRAFHSDSSLRASGTPAARARSRTFRGARLRIDARRHLLQRALGHHGEGSYASPARCARASLRHFDQERRQPRDRERLQPLRPPDTSMRVPYRSKANSSKRIRRVQHASLEEVRVFAGSSGGEEESLRDEQPTSRTAASCLLVSNPSRYRLPRSRAMGRCGESTAGRDPRLPPGTEWSILMVSTSILCRAQPQPARAEVSMCSLRTALVEDRRARDAICQAPARLPS